MASLTPDSGPNQSAVLGRWYIDLERTVLRWEPSRIALKGAFYEFFADGTYYFWSQFLCKRGKYSVSGREVVKVPMQLGGPPRPGDEWFSSCLSTNENRPWRAPMLISADGNSLVYTEPSEEDRRLGLVQVYSRSEEPT